MEDAKSWMLIASIVGAAGGIYFNSVVNPLNNYFMFLFVFALIGICFANLLLLLLVELNRWQKRSNKDSKETAENM
jgi:hypothetical protein